MLAVITGNVQSIRTPARARERSRLGGSRDGCEHAQRGSDCVAHEPIGRRGFDRMQQHFTVKALTGAYPNANTTVL
jgi:hypothetical protein